jgi:molybdopterin-guanine dinucleotide biosynthesis protein A
MSAPPLNGLLLAGGKSRRMGSDKADLAVHGPESLRDRGMRLLKDLTTDCFLSIAADDDRPYSIPTLRDALPDHGPLGGILTALELASDRAWLVLACDLPNLDLETLAQLIASRDPTADATCFRSPVDGVPEALCTIYEPSAVTSLRETVGRQKLCARRFLDSLRLNAIPLDNETALQNCNRPEDLEELRLQLEDGRTEKSVTLEFFAKLRDEAGCSAMAHTTSAATAAGLWDEIRLLHNLSMDLDSVRLAVNDEFAPWTRPLAPDDRIAFMPPFAGG